MFGKKTETQKRLDCLHRWYPLIEGSFHNAGGTGALEIIGSTATDSARDWSDIDLRPEIATVENQTAAIITEALVRDLRLPYRVHIHVENR